MILMEMLFIPRKPVNMDLMDLELSFIQILMEMVIQGMELLARSADSILGLEPLVRQMTGKRLLGVSREAIGRLTTLSLVYRFQRDPRHLQKLEEELKAVCEFNNWNPFS